MFRDTFCVIDLVMGHIKRIKVWRLDHGGFGCGYDHCNYGGVLGEKEFAACKKINNGKADLQTYEEIKD